MTLKSEVTHLQLASLGKVIYNMHESTNVFLTVFDVSNISACFAASFR